MATRTDKNGTVWEVDAQGNPIRPVSTGPQPIMLSQGDPYASQKAQADAAASQFDPAIKQTQLQNAQNQQPNEQFNQRDKLRADWEGLAPVKEYRAAVSALASALKTAPDAGGDNALIYAYAKIMDPASVVRESEMQMAGSTDSTISRLAARFAKEFGIEGGGQLSEETRQRLRREAINSVSQRVKIYNNQRERFSEYARRSNYDPYDIVGPHDGAPFVEQFKGYGKKDGIIESVIEGRAYANDGTTTKTGNNGFDKYVTEQDRERTSQLQSAYEAGASADELNRMAQDLGLQTFSPADINAMMEARKRGERLRISPNATGTRSLAQQVMGSLAESPAAAFGGAAVNAATFGNLDEITGMLGGDARLAQYAKEYARDESPIASFAGDIVGGSAIGGPMTAGARYAGIKGAQAASPFVAKMLNTAAGSLPRAAVSAATLQGALTGAGEMNDNRALGALIGGGAGLTGGYLGGKLFGAGGNAAMSGPATRAGNRIRGLFGSRQRPEVPLIDKPSQMVNSSINGQFDNVLSQLDEAQSFGLPMTLADTDPALRSLAGATVRRSPEAKGVAENSLIPRQRGQYDRLIGAIDRDLGPITNVPQLSDDLIKQGRAASAPLYDAAYSAPGASSVDISGIIKTPIGQRGIQQAGLRVQNQLGPDGQPVNPQTLGFDFNEAGETMLTKTPSFQQLDYFKQGLDDIIEGGYDPITRSYTPEAQAATALKQRLVTQIDEVNPAYKDARAAYAGPAADRDALQQGKAALNLPPDAMNFQRQGLAQSQQAQYGLGYRSGMAEQAGRVRFSGNPWESAYGTPQAQAKVGALFPEGSPRFGKQYGLESEMARTNNAILGNSMTAERQIADQAFDMGAIPTIAMDAATTGTPVMTAARLGSKLAGGELGRIGAKKKAEALAPILFDADPAKNAALMRELQKNIKVQRKAKGMFGAKSRGLGSRVIAAPSVGFALGLTD